MLTPHRQSIKSRHSLKVSLTKQEVIELARRRRVVDMMLTAHSVLRDRYARRASVVDVIGLAFSVVLCLFTWPDPALIRYAGVNDNLARIILGLCAAAVFCVSVVQLRVDWKARGAEHQKAAEKLARVKALYRRVKHEVENSGGEGEDRLASAFEEGDALIEDIRAIPEREFIPLKALHNRKVTVSRVLDRFPGASLRLLRWAIWWRHTGAALQSGATNQSSDR
jgi:hypothetical protein